MHILAYASQACSVGDRGSAMQSCDWSLLLIGLAAENHSKASGRALVCVCGVIFKVCCMSLQSCISYQVLEFQDLAKSWIARTWSESCFYECCILEVCIPASAGFPVRDVAWKYASVHHQVLDA